MMIKRIEFNVLGCGMNTRTTANELLIDVAHERLNNWLASKMEFGCLFL